MNNMHSQCIFLIVFNINLKETKYLIVIKDVIRYIEMLSFAIEKI